MLWGKMAYSVGVHRIWIRIRPDIRWIWWIRYGSGSGRTQHLQIRYGSYVGSGWIQIFYLQASMAIHKTSEDSCLSVFTCWYDTVIANAADFYMQLWNSCGNHLITHLSQLNYPMCSGFTVFIPSYGSMVGILSLLFVCTVTDFSAAEKRQQRETSRACLTTIRDELLPF